MGGGLARAQLLCFGVLGIVVFINLQYIFSSDDNQGAVHIHTQHFVHSQQFAFAHAAGLPVLRRIVGDTPGAKLLGLAGDGDAGFSSAVRDELRGQGIGTAEKQGDVTVAQNLLPLVVRVAVLEAGKVLEHARHTDIPGADDRNFSAQVRNDPAGAQFLAQHMDGDGERTAGAVLISIPYQLNEDEGQK